MSQAKVDRYKEEKRNRAKIMAKEKRDERLFKIGASVVALALVAWVGVSAYTSLTRKPETTASTELESFEVNADALTDYLDSLGMD